MISGHPCFVHLGHENEEFACDRRLKSNGLQRTMLFRYYLVMSAEGSTIKMELLSLGLTFSSRFYALKIFHEAKVLTFPCVDGLLLSAALHLGWVMQRVPICLRSCFLINELYD